MATRGSYQQNGFRRQVGSPKAKGRENKDTICRNITIYGHCRYENSGCTFNHDQAKSGGSSSDMSKKSFNADSPAFQPSGSQPTTKKPTFSAQALNASVFTPRGSGAATPTGVASNVKQDATFSSNAATVAEFTPQGFGLASSTATAASTTPANDGLPYDAYAMASLNQALPVHGQYNLYSEDHNTALGAANTFYPPQTAYSSDPQAVQPLHHHLYFPVGPHRDDLLPYQRLPHDFFTSEKLRQEATKKLEAVQQVIHTGLPAPEGYHSLLALDTTNRKNAALFGFPTWVYKAFETKTGWARCLRRLEGFRLTSDVAIRQVKDWKRVDCANVVPVHGAFSTRAFGDSSLVFVQEYFPLAKTLLETHFPPHSALHGNRHKVQTINERTLWSYVTQIGNALKAIHSANLAARCLDLGKIIVTDKNRIRLSGCAILDVVQFENIRPAAEHQPDDLHMFGNAILSLASNIHPTLLGANYSAALDQLKRNYSAELRDAVIWLVSPQQPNGQAKTIDEFIRGTYAHFVTALNDSFNNNDHVMSEYMTSLENGRHARLMMKLAAINERPDLNGDTKWAENGDRYTLKLFRDHVFHQVDENGKPVVDIGHMITCLNKLDAGVDEQICLTSRDNETIFVVTYKKMKELLRNSFAELTRGSKGRVGL